MSDRVNHPTHYNSHPSGVEAIDVCESLPFNVGNAVKYVMRHGYKGSAVEDLKKAKWYIDRELNREDRFTGTAYDSGDENLLVNITKIIDSEPNVAIKSFFINLSRIILGHNIDTHLKLMMEAVAALFDATGESNE